MVQLVLASTSPFRKALLQRLCMSFVTDAPAVDETPLPDEPPQDMVVRLAEAKARVVAQRHPGALIIGSDQCAVLDGRPLGKPGNHHNAVEQLRRLSGRRVVFQTGLCLFNDATGEAQSCCVSYAVSFRELNDAQIENYLHKEQPYNCAGSFKSEGLGVALFERMEGDDPSALIGLPLIELVSMLKCVGIEVLADR